MMAWPPQPNTWQFELMRASFSVLVATVTLVLTWLVGQRLTARWSLWQKRREIELQTATKFYQLYGEFITNSGLWKAVREVQDPDARNERKWKVLERASIAEGEMEAICLKIAAERKLTEAQARDVGMFRRMYQELRFRIRTEQALDWNYESNGFQAFKEYAGKTASLLPSMRDEPPLTARAAINLARVTSVTRDDILPLAGREAEVRIFGSANVVHVGR
jgi:hypothetical protein